MKSYSLSCKVLKQPSPSSLQNFPSCPSRKLRETSKYYLMLKRAKSQYIFWISLVQWLQKCNKAALSLWTSNSKSNMGGATAKSSLKTLLSPKPGITGCFPRLCDFQEHRICPCLIHKKCIVNEMCFGKFTMYV